MKRLHLVPLTLAVAASAVAAAAPAVGVHAATPGATTRAAAFPVVAVQGERNDSMYVSLDGRPFVSYGGVIKGAPAVVSAGGRHFYFARAMDDDLYVRTDTTGFTQLQRGRPFVCATPPAVISEPDSGYLVGCIGRNDELYAIAGTLPSTGNPVSGTVYSAIGGDFESDLTSPPGGLGVDGHGDFVALGQAYPASVFSAGPAAGTEPSPAGNTYLLQPRGNTAYVFQPGGTCGGAPAITGDYFDSDASYVVTCRLPGSAVTRSYEEQKSGSGSSETFTTHVVTVGGSIVGSPVSAADPSGDGLDILATGSNGRIYSATVTSSGTTGYALDPRSAAAASGPGID